MRKGVFLKSAHYAGISQGGQIDASVVDHNVFWQFSAVFGSSAQLLMDICTDGRMDRPSYRDARTHLKSVKVAAHRINRWSSRKITKKEKSEVGQGY